MAELKGVNGAVGVYETKASWRDADTDERKEGVGTFEGPANPASIEGYLAGLQDITDENGKVVETATEQREYFYETWLAGRTNRMNASLRPAVAVENATFTQDGVRYNLATGERTKIKGGGKMPALSVDKCVAALNMTFDRAASLGVEPPSWAGVAKRLIIENKRAIVRGNKLEVAKA